VLFFREAHDPNTWIAQALEHDIAAHGEDVERAKLAFERTVSGHLQLAAKYHQEPLASLQPAPNIFWDLWKLRAEKTVEATRISSSAAYMLPVVSNDPLQAAH
jgi:hypothetical protein